MSHIRSTEYRRLLAMILRLHADLPTTVQMRGPTGAKREKRLMYRLTAGAMSHFMLEGFVIDGVDTNAQPLTSIDPEEAFVQNAGFWVGSPIHVYKDYSTERDKKNKLVWAATYERDCNFTSFAVDLEEPIISVRYSRAQMENVADDLAETKGSVLNAFNADRQQERVIEGVRLGTLVPSFGKDIVDPVVDAPVPSKS